MTAGKADATQTHHFVSPTLQFFNYPQRSSEQMHFSINVLLYTAVETKHHLKTVDLSIMGLQVKANKNVDVKLEDNVVIVFDGLANEYSAIANTTIEYDVVRIVEHSDELRIFLHRAQAHNEPQVTEFIANFIRGNKYRYKINLENTINAFENKVCEQYFTPRFPSLPVFISHQVDKADPQIVVLQPKFAMSNSGNANILSYWQDEQHQQRIGNLVSHMSPTQAYIPLSIPNEGHKDAKNAMNIAFFINQRTHLFTPEFSVYNQGDGRLKSMLSRFSIEGHFNLEFLYRDREQPSPFIRRCLAQLKMGIGEQEHEIFIRYCPEKTHINDVIVPYINQQFTSITQRQQFIKKALAVGEFAAIKLILKDTTTVELDTIKTELDYLHEHANYKAEKVVDKLKPIQGFGYILDITDEVLYRHGYDWQMIQANHPQLVQSKVG
jgi:hypothetical protein